MEYFKRQVSKPGQQPLSAGKAKEIFDLLKAGYDETTIFEEKGHHTYHIEQVKEEFKVVKAEVYAKVSVDKAPTKTALRDSLTVNKLDANDCINTVIAWDEKDPEEPKTWAQFVAKYKPAVEAAQL